MGTPTKKKQLDDPVTLPETNSSALKNMPFQKETIVFQPSIFGCYVSFRKGSPIQMNWSSLAGVFKVHNFESNTKK